MIFILRDAASKERLTSYTGTQARFRSRHRVKAGVRPFVGSPGTPAHSGLRAKFQLARGFAAQRRHHLADGGGLGDIQGAVAAPGDVAVHAAQAFDLQGHRGARGLEVGVACGERVFGGGDLLCALFV